MLDKSSPTGPRSTPAWWCATRRCPRSPGRFVYGDTASGRLYSARLRRPRASDDRSLGFALEGVAGIGEDAAGCVYAASLNGGVYRFVENSTAIPCPRPPAFADRVPPRLRVRVPGRQRVRKRRGAIGYARCSETCRVAMSGRLSIGRHSYRLRKTTRRAASRRIRLRVRLTRRGSRALRRALAQAPARVRGPPRPRRVGQPQPAGQAESSRSAPRKARSAGLAVSARARRYAAAASSLRPSRRSRSARAEWKRW